MMMNRIEVLEGPQGTLYGAGAEAGVVGVETGAQVATLGEDRNETSVKLAEEDARHAAQLRSLDEALDGLRLVAGRLEGCVDTKAGGHRLS